MPQAWPQARCRSAGAVYRAPRKRARHMPHAMRANHSSFCPRFMDRSCGVGAGRHTSMREGDVPCLTWLTAVQGRFLGAQHIKQRAERRAQVRKHQHRFRVASPASLAVLPGSARRAGQKDGSDVVDGRCPSTDNLGRHAHGHVAGRHLRRLHTLFLHLFLQPQVGCTSSRSLSHRRSSPPTHVAPRRRQQCLLARRRASAIHHGSP